MPHNESFADKQDRRVQRTQRLLRAALFALITEKDYAGITVKDITARADVNRATFYLHYRDKEDLLWDCSKDVFDDLVARFGPIDMDNLALDRPLFHLVLVFQHVARMSRVYQVLLSMPAFMTQVKAHIVTLIVTRIDQLLRLHAEAHGAGAILADPVFIAHFAAGALIGVLSWWLESGMSHSPEYMADRFGWLTVAGCYPMLGFTPLNLNVEGEG